MSAVVTISRRI